MHDINFVSNNRYMVVDMKQHSYPNPVLRAINYNNGY